MARTTKLTKARQQPSEPTSLVPDLLDPAYQYTLLLPDDPALTRSIGLLDVVPLWTLDQSHRRNQDNVPIYERPFHAFGVAYKLITTPAHIKTKDGERRLYVGGRELKVELVIRKIAIDKCRFSNVHNTVFVSVGLYEIYAEMKRHNKTMKYSEINEAIDVMVSSQFEITRADGTRTEDGDVVLIGKKASLFPNIEWRAADNETKLGGKQVVIQLNSLVSDAIRKVNFHDFDYDRQMRLQPMALIVFRWLHHTVFCSKVPLREVSISMRFINEMCGIKDWRPSEQFKNLESDTMKELVDEDILKSFTSTKTMEEASEGKRGRRAILDAEFHMVLSDRFLAQINRARGGLLEMRKRFQDETGVSPDEGKWAKPIRRRRTAPAVTVDGGNVLKLPFEAS